ncbi:cellobiose dehydrogenase [Penicillium brasilianum]|uniref:Cellobiose dehydrogenase n=1 Tax=Penicillium brasilianum TaxID=104259 RepID=A0A1S9RU24_PENBI|nr:cellobiose dehydrogenase [Penicillium brasilianum]
MAVLYLCWLAWAASSLAQLQSFHPSGHDDLTYSINVPQSTSQSGSGSIYFQLNSTRNVRWFALGQGTRMVGANIFVVYPNGDNVTVSPRLGMGEIQPLYNSDAHVSLLEGSGFSNGAITANIRCDSCMNWTGGSEDLTSTSSSWLWAVKYGSPLDSSDVSAELTQHDDSGVVNIDLVKATGGSLDNPFFDTSKSSTPTTVITATAQNPNTVFNQKKTAHAVMMIIAFVIMFPCFALTMQIFPSSRTATVHGLLQLLTLIVALVGLGLGVSMAKELNLLTNHHPIIGLVVVSSLTLFQPIMGLLQHRFYRKTRSKGIFAYVHRWFGRTMIVLGIINAGLGLQLARGPKGAIIAYSVVAGVMGLFYCAVVVWVQWGRKRSR